MRGAKIFLAIDRLAFGDQHPKVAIRLNNLGMAWQARGDYRKAGEYLKKALAIKEKYLGCQHPDTKTCKKNLEIAEKMAFLPWHQNSMKRRLKNVIISTRGNEGACHLVYSGASSWPRITEKDFMPASSISNSMCPWVLSGMQYPAVNSSRVNPCPGTGGKSEAFNAASIPGR